MSIAWARYKRVSDKSRILVGALAFFASAGAAGVRVCQAQVTYPARVGAINVREAPYNAKGDGKTDDTEAIQKALTEGLDKHKVVYLPAGTYLVSDTLRWRDPSRKNDNADGWGRFLMVQGYSRTKTVIRLKNACPGFTDPATPKAVMQTGSSAGHGEKHYTNGEGNEAFENHIRDLTVDTGRGNTGAIGIGYQASNCAAMRHVTVRSGDGSGVSGINLTRRDNGPGVLKDITVNGFRVGIQASRQEVCTFVIEDARLIGQAEAGIVNSGSILSVRKLVTQGRVPALKVSGGSLTHILDSRFSGDPTGKMDAASVPAIHLEGTDARLHVRNLKTWRFNAAIRSRDSNVKKETLAEWVSDSPPSGLSGGDLRLPVRETPEYWEPDPTLWADAGDPTYKDDTNALQAALDSGKAVVSLHYGTYHISRPLRVPPTVRLIFGVGSGIDTTEGVKPGEAVFRVIGGSKSTPPLIIDRIVFGAGGRFIVEHESPRAVALQDLLPFGGDVYQNKKGAGPLFLDDVCGSGYKFNYPTQVWARNLDSEGGDEPNILNNSGTIWALGFKHEGEATMVENRAGGRMEMLGGLVYTFGTPPDKAAFVNEVGSTLSLSLLGVSFAGGERPFFPVIVRPIVADGKPSGADYPSGAAGRGTMLRLLRGGPTAVAVPPATTTLKGRAARGKSRK